MGANREDKTEQVQGAMPKQNQTEPDLRLSFLGAGEAEPQSKTMDALNAFVDCYQSEPNASIKRKARQELGQRMKPKKKRAVKKSDVVIDLTNSDNEGKANDDTSVNLGRPDGNDVTHSLASQEKKQQEQAGVSGDGKKELSEEEIQRLLWKYVVRAREKEAAELKERNEKAVREGRPIEQATDSWSDSAVYEEEPWTLDEDEELARWKLGGFSDKQLDWPTFHESRTWEDLMERVTWLETKHPKCWAVLEVLEDEEQESFERELSVEIADLKAKGLLSDSSDEMSDGETEDETVEELDEMANGE